MPESSLGTGDASRIGLILEVFALNDLSLYGQHEPSVFHEPDKELNHKF